MKTAKSQVGRPRGWVRAPIVQTGTFCAMMRGCGVALPGSSPLDLRLCRPHHMYTCNVSVSSHAAVLRAPSYTCRGGEARFFVRDALLLVEGVQRHETRVTRLGVQTQTDTRDDLLQLAFVRRLTRSSGVYMRPSGSSPFGPSPEDPMPIFYGPGPCAPPAPAQIQKGVGAGGRREAKGATTRSRNYEHCEIRVAPPGAVGARPPCLGG